MIEIKKVYPIVSAILAFLGLSSIYIFGFVSEIPRGLRPILDVYFFTQVITGSFVGVVFYLFVARMIFYFALWVLSMVSRVSGNLGKVNKYSENCFDFLDRWGHYSTGALAMIVFALAEFQLARLNWFLFAAIFGVLASIYVAAVYAYKRGRDSHSGDSRVLGIYEKGYFFLPLVMALSAFSYSFGRAQVEERLNKWDFTIYGGANFYLIGSTSDGVIAVSREFQEGASSIGYSTSMSYSDRWCFIPFSAGFTVVSVPSFDDLPVTSIEPGLSC